MPIPSSDPLSENYPDPWIRPWLRRALLVVVVPAVAIMSLLEYIAVWSAVTGYWGPEWPTVWQDTGWMTAIWLFGLASLFALAARPIRHRWAKWRGGRTGARTRAWRDAP